jgi:dipeptidyl aminopeptidase/acylaminoacyl peptidase
MPGGARRQITFDDDPVGEVRRRPGGPELVFTRDSGGSEFSQIFMLDPVDGASLMLTDGESRNGAIVWDRSGGRLAWQSTRRNGASNDIWLMDPEEPAAAELVLQSPDGSWWGPIDFSANGSELLVLNYISASDSRVHLVDLDDGGNRLLAGGDDAISTNFPLAFDAAGDGFWLVTDRQGEFAQLAWQSIDDGAEPEVVTSGIPWDINDGDISHDRRRLAFVANENGLSRVYLMDTGSRRYRAVDSVPTGIVRGLAFSPDDRHLALTLSTPGTPSDTFVLELGKRPLDFGQLVRWTESEVGGLDTDSFALPSLVEFPTFDDVAGEPRRIPAWVYKPPGVGPFPVVISVHGGPEGQARPWFNSTYQMWVDKLGVAVVEPNVRGSAGYGKSYLALDNGMKREDSVRDIGALLDWIDAEPTLDAGRVAVFGGSYGGYMVLASSVHYSDRLKAAVDIVGISNFVTFLENTEDYRRDLRRAEYGDERIPEMRAHLEAISPMNNLSQISVPLLVVQGQNDPRVPVTESGQLVEALRERGQPVWYMNALNEGHGYKRKENRDVYQQAVVLFLEQYLLDPR